MKAFIVLLSLSSVALASLEPASYRAPSSPSQYLPPHLQHQQHQQDQPHQSHQHHSQPLNPSAPVANQYLPPTYDRATPPPASPSSQYLPPQQQHHQARARPSPNYLPATEKPALSSLLPSPPSNDYLPPPPSSDYLPPVSRAQPTQEYLPPQVPSNDYLPPKNEYLPPTTLSKKAPSPLPVAPKSEYLPPVRQSAPVPRPSTTTPTPRISVISVSPYKLDGPAYSKPQQQQRQPNLGGLATSATASPFSGYPPAGAPGLGVKNFEQSADNYLPPVASVASEGYDAVQTGYRYGGAGASGAAREEQSTEPAKYDFEYRVSDEFGNDYAHKESREGSHTHGLYSVLLPDGRKQIVSYEADENGFKPRISYEEAATVLGSKTPAFAGYDKNANSLDARGPY